MNEPPPSNTSSNSLRDRLLPPADFPELGRPHLPVPYPSSSLDPTRTAVKRTAEEDPEDLQDRPSKAPRLADSSSDMAEAVVEPEPALKDLICRELSCSVCTDIFHHPVTLTPCLHSFCGSCAARWLELQPTCPTCRTRVHSTSPNALVASLVASYLSAHPSAQPRDAAEIEELAGLYKPGDKIYITEDGGDSDNSDDEDRHHDDEDDHSDSDEEIMGLSRHAPPYTPSGLPSVPNFSTVAWPPAPCPCCDPTNSYGYICPIPLRHFPSQTRYFPIHVACQQSENNHVICTACTRTVPTGFRGHPDSCGTCGHVSCAKIWECPARPNGGRGWINTLEAQEIFPGLTPEELEDPNLIKNTSMPLFNEVEFKIFKQYMVANKRNLNWVSSEFKTFLTRNSPTPTTYDMICKTCISQLWFQQAMPWWIDHKFSILDRLDEDRQQQEQEAIKMDDDTPSRAAVVPPGHEDRDWCWYGYQCWTQWSQTVGPNGGPPHRDRYNHACQPIPLGETRLETHGLPLEERQRVLSAQLARGRERRQQRMAELDRERERREQNRAYLQNIPMPYPPPPMPPALAEGDLQRRHEQLLREDNNWRNEMMAQATERIRQNRERAALRQEQERRDPLLELQEREAQRQLLNHGVGQAWRERISMGSPFEQLGVVPGESQEGGNDRRQDALGSVPRFNGEGIAVQGIGRAGSYYGEVVDMPDNVELGEQ